ncbi:MAG: NADH:ubiquinone reductase (Na(+)-transporting) subunit A, partial [Bacteroidota bacterium]|nr:NADH:ubiquinone reductase (Na(+)-transporting) subunit A [Bacteroidota bacterium]
MSNVIKVDKGFNINLAGKAEKVIANSPQPETFVVRPTDFLGIKRPKNLVNVGDTVKAGTPVLIDKKNERIVYTAPVSGEIVEIKRGEKRSLLEIIILADKTIEFTDFKKHNTSEITSLSKEVALDKMLNSGIWPF